MTGDPRPVLAGPNPPAGLDVTFPGNGGAAPQGQGHSMCLGVPARDKPAVPEVRGQSEQPVEGSALQPGHQRPRQSLPRGPSTSRGHCRGERPERASALPGPTLPPAHASTVLLPVRDAGTHPGTGAGRMRSPPLHPAPQPEPLPVRWQQETAALAFPT